MFEFTGKWILDTVDCLQLKKCLPDKKRKENLNQIVINKVLRLEELPYDAICDKYSKRPKSYYATALGMYRQIRALAISQPVHEIINKFPSF